MRTGGLVNDLECGRNRSVILQMNRTLQNMMFRLILSLIVGTSFLRIEFKQEILS